MYKWNHLVKFRIFVSALFDTQNLDHPIKKDSIQILSVPILFSYRQATIVEQNKLKNRHMIATPVAKSRDT